MTVEDINNSIDSSEPLNINTRHVYLEEVYGGDHEIVSGELVDVIKAVE